MSIPSASNDDHIARSGADLPSPAATPTPLPAIWCAEPPPSSAALSSELARRLLEHLTDTGDIVLDIDDDTVLARTAAETGRRHHGLAGHHYLLNNRHYTGTAHLAFLRWPRPAADTELLLAACRTLLDPTGHLVIAIGGPPTDRATHLHALTGAAHHLGMPLQEHIAVNARIAPTDKRPRPHDHGVPHTNLLIFTTAGDDHA
jgi:hypothetical protein